MGKAARVSSVDAIVQFRAWLVEYNDRSRQALMDGQMEVQRTIMWLENEQLYYWKNQIHKREQRMEEARSEWYRARLGVPEMRTNTSSERMAYQKAENRLLEAKQKLDHVKQWRKRLSLSDLSRRQTGQVQYGRQEIDHRHRLAEALSRRDVSWPDEDHRDRGQMRVEERNRPFGTEGPFRR